MRTHPGITIISLIYAAVGITSVVSVFLSVDVFYVLDVDARTFENLLWAYLPYAVLQFAIAALLMASKNAGRIVAMVLVGFALVLDALSIVDGYVLGVLWLALNAAVILYLRSPGIVRHYAGGKVGGR